MHRALPAAVLLLALALPAAAGELPRGVAGITLGLSVNQAHARLARIGVRATETEAREREAGPGVEQEMWTLRDPRYSYLQARVEGHPPFDPLVWTTSRRVWRGGGLHPGCPRHPRWGARAHGAALARAAPRGAVRDRARPRSLALDHESRGNARRTAGLSGDR